MRASKNDPVAYMYIAAATAADLTMPRLAFRNQALADQEYLSIESVHSNG